LEANCLGAEPTEETDFPAGIEVDLDWGGELKTRGNQHAKDLNGIDGTGTTPAGRDQLPIYSF